jgi:SAM-dependent methyltransferase
MQARETRDELLKAANERLYPSLRSPNYLVLTRRRKIIMGWLERMPKEKLRVLDVGARYQPYRPLFQGRTEKYVAVDVISTDLVDVVADGQDLPFMAEAFDVVICTGVFEFFPEPRIAAREVYSVLKTGGILIMSVASVNLRFRDDEHWRFLPAGIRSLLSQFSQVEIVPELFNAGSVCRFLNYSLDFFAKYNAIRALFSVTAYPMLNLLGAGVERLAISENDQFASNYSILAQK